MALRYPVLWSKLTVLTLFVSAGGLLSAHTSHAEMVMGIELSPTMCRMHPNYSPLRQCAENRPVNVSYFSTGLQGRCSTQIKLALPPLQEKVTARVVADPYMREQLWQSYGVCSGLTAPSYFHQLTNFFNTIKLPPEVLTNGRVRLNQGSFLQQLNRDNPTLSPQSVSLFCQTGSNRLPVLTHMNICYSNTGNYTRCSTIRPSNCPSTFYIEGR